MPEFFETESDVTIKEHISREVYVHEVFLAFRNDPQAEAFIYWLNESGFRSFKEWTIKNGGNYE